MFNLVQTHPHLQTPSTFMFHLNLILNCVTFFQKNKTVTIEHSTVSNYTLVIQLFEYSRGTYPLYSYI